MPKLVYSLVLLPEPIVGLEMTHGVAASDTFDLLFQVHYMDPRFRGEDFLTSNGWSIRSSSSPEIQFPSRSVYLLGARRRVGETRPIWDRLTAVSIEDARSQIVALHAALADWAENFPGFLDPAVDGPPLSLEVQESLLVAEDSEDQPEDEDVDAPPPVDEFHPNKISI